MEQADGSVLDASIQLLSQGDLQPASDSSWELVSSEEGPGNDMRFPATADRSGTLHVPAGDWSIRSADQKWTSVVSRVTALPGRTVVLWVQRISSRRFRVTAPSGDPIAAVRAIWIPRREATVRPDPDSLAPVIAESDAKGLVEFESCPCENGTVVFLHANFAREELFLCGPPSDTLRVVLHPNADGRTLSFTQLDGVTPVQGVIMAAAAGYEIARAAPNSASIVVPSWVRPDESVLITSPSTHPSYLKLARVRGDFVPLPSARIAKIEVDASSDCSDEIYVTASFPSTDASSPIEPILDELPVRTRASVPVSLALPGGRPMAIRAYNRCGALDEANLAPEDDHPVIRLVLRPTTTFLVRVVDPRGAPIPSSHAFVESYGTFQANASGEIRIPASLDIATFDVWADGFCKAVATRNAVMPSSAQAQELRITLAESIEATFVVRSEGEAALPGMRVRVRSQVASPVTGDTGNPQWSTSRVRSSVTGTTDASGTCVVRGVPAGLASVEVNLPSELGSGPYVLSPYPAASSELALAQGEVHVLHVPEPIHLSLEVIDGTTGMHPPGFELQTADPMLPPLSVRGGFWQGWMSSEVQRLSVVVENVGTGVLSLDTHDREVSRIVTVGPSPLLLLRILDLPETPGEIRLEIQVLRSSSSGRHLERTIIGHPTPMGDVSLDIEDTEGLWIGIAEQYAGGQRLRFEPESQAVDSTAVPVFRCVRP